MPSENEKKELKCRITEFMLALKRPERLDSSDVAKRTIDILKRIISQTRWNHAQDLMDTIREEGRHLMQADPSASCVANMVRRILKIIREEFIAESKGQGAVEQEGTTCSQDVFDIDFTQPCPNLKATVMASIGELFQEIEASRENIAMQALEHIHADATIMTFGRSKTVEAFLKNAARKRRFHVIVAEGEPFFEGHQMAKSLSEAGVQVTLVPDTHVFALMCKVNKVIIGTHTIMAEGGLKAPCGTFNMALAAKRHMVPVLVCAGTYKISPVHFRSQQQEGFQKYFDPRLVLPDWEEMEGVEVGNVVFEHIEHDFVDLFVFNVGTNGTSMVYQLQKEFYHPDDVEL